MKKMGKWIPILVSVILMALLYIQHLSIELTIPSEGWSRMVKLNIHSSHPIRVSHFQNGDKQEMLVPTDKSIEHILVNSALEVEEVDSIPVSADTNTPIWYKEGLFVYQKGEALYSYGNENSLIAENIQKLAIKGDLILYSLQNELYQYNPETKSSSLFYSFSHPIANLQFSKTADDILVVIQESDVLKSLYLIHNGNATNISHISLGSSARLDEIDFDTNEKNGLILYNLMSQVQGVKSYSTYYLSFSLDDIQKQDPTILRWKGNKPFSSAARDLQVSLNEKVSILFTAYGQTKGKYEGTNVYEAFLLKNDQVFKDAHTSELNKVMADGNFKVERRSNSNLLADNPFPLNHKVDALAWIGYDGQQYQLVGTTTDKEVVEKINKANQDDYLNAGYESVTSMFNAILVLFFAMLWAFPPALLYGISFIIQGHRFESNKSAWIVPLAFILYLGSQIYFFTYLFSHSLSIIAPDYLKIENGLIIWPTVLGLLTYLIYKLVKGEESNKIKDLAYLVGTNVLYVSLLIGVYIF